MNNASDFTKFGRSSIYDPVPFNKRHSIGSLFGSPLMANNNSLGSQEKATFKGSASVHLGGSFSDTNDTFSLRKKLASSLAEPSTNTEHHFSHLDSNISNCHNNNIHNTTGTSIALSNASVSPVNGKKDGAFPLSTSSNSSVLSKESKFQNFGKKSELLNVPSPVIESNKTGARPLSPIYSLMLRTDY